MSAPWQWDETLYAGAAPFYLAGRRPYPQAIPGLLAERLGLDGSGALLDVGCGPGSLTLLLAPLFRRTVGIDADAGMVAAASERAELAGAGQVSFRQLRAEELPAGLGTFQLVSFAQSFHWTSQLQVAGTVRQMIEPGGACLLLYGATSDGAEGNGQLAYPYPPRAAIGTLVGRYLGPVRRAGRGQRPGFRLDGDAMRQAGFDGPERIEAGGGEVWQRSEDEVVASVFSLSWSAPGLFGDRRADFERELRALLRDASPDGWFCEVSRPIAIDLWRPPDRAASGTSADRDTGSSAGRPHRG
ncbi:MAG TPA: class I SAM-dependent methyltransferase [Streptosporangiaceae bacterium]